jgi:acetolactate synthase I/II/III large subunit
VAEAPDDLAAAGAAALARGMGVKATRASTVAEFDARLAEALATPGPHLIEAMV